jgi:hypothetical protein
VVETFLYISAVWTRQLTHFRSFKLSQDSSVANAPCDSGQISATVNPCDRFKFLRATTPRTCTAYGRTFTYIRIQAADGQFGWIPVSSAASGTPDEIYVAEAPALKCMGVWDARQPDVSVRVPHDTVQSLIVFRHRMQRSARSSGERVSPSTQTPAPRTLRSRSSPSRTATSST